MRSTPEKQRKRRGAWESLAVSLKWCPRDHEELLSSFIWLHLTSFRVVRAMALWRASRRRFSCSRTASTYELYLVTDDAFLDHKFYQKAQPYMILHDLTMHLRVACKVDAAIRGEVTRCDMASCQEASAVYSCA